MKDLVQRIKENKDISSVADWEINRLKVLGLSNVEIKKRLQGLLHYTNSEINRIYSDTLEKSYVRDSSLYDTLNAKQIPFRKNKELQAIIKAYKDQTQGEFINITQTLGFAKRAKADGKMVFTKVAEYYQQTLDSAITEIATGTFDYNTVLKRVVSEMTASGLRTVNYASGRAVRMDTAARAALMTGFSQTVQKMNDSVAKDLGTEYYEVDWHGGARPSHQAWQGKVWSRQQLVDICGLGTPGGILGVNCYHSYFPFIKGVSTRTYTDSQLKAMNAEENKPKTYLGKEYTKYEALQRQRQLETLMRQQRQEINLLKKGGADDEAVLKRAKYRTTSAQYAEFSKAMELPQQRQRVTVGGLNNLNRKLVVNNSKSDIMVSGARITNLFSKEAEDFANKYYEEIRHFTTDFKKIAKNIGKSESNIRKIKAYLFEENSLYHPDTDEWTKFDPDCAIAQSWQRLMLGKDIKKHDRTLIEHELYEMELKEKYPNISHKDAHRIAEEKYNYSKEAEEYYGSIKKH